MKPTTKTMKNRLLFPTLLSLTLAAGGAHAATGTFAGTTGDPYWDADASNWTGVTGNAWNATNGPNNIAILPAGAGITTAGVPVTNGIIWQAGRTLSSGTVKLDGTNPFLSVPSGQTSQVWSNLTGTAGVTKTGLGTVALTAGIKGITGGFIVNQGILQLDWDNSSRDGSVGSVDSSNTLTLGGGGLTVKGKGGSGNVTTQTLGNLTLNAGGNTIKIDPNNSVAGSTTVNLGTWTKNSWATLYVDFSSSNTGTKVLAFTTTPAVDADGLIGAYATINAASGNGNYGFAAVSGSNIVRYTGATVLTANLGTDTVSATNYQISGAQYGTLQLTGSSATQTVNTLDVAMGNVNSNTAKTLVINSGGLMFSRADTGVVVNTGNNLAVTSGTSELVVSVLGTIGGSIGAKIAGGVKDNGGTSVSLVKAGPGTLYMDTVTSPGTNSYTGDTVVNQGVLQNIATIPSGTGKGNLVVNAAGTVSLGVASPGGTRTINGLSNTSAVGGLVNNSNANGTAATTFLNLGNGDATASFSGVISGNLGIIKSGTGTQTLSGVNTYTGNTTVNAGTLSLGNGTTNSSLDDLSSVTIAATAHLNLNFSVDNPDTVKELYLGTPAVLVPAGTYNSSTPTYGSYFTGTGSLIVTTGAVNNNYDAWASANGASGEAANLDHDNDGVPNGIEYFIGGPDGHTNGFTPVSGVTTTAGVSRVTWAKAASYIGAYNTDYVVETTETLAAGSWTTVSLGAVNEPGKVNISGNNVTYTFPAGPVKKFARLKVTGP